MIDEGEHISKFRQIFFNIGFMGYGMFTSVILFFQSVFLLEIAEVPSAWVGNILIIKQIWDGGIDPFIGVASDKISTRFGRRRPWMLIFTWPLLICWIAMWIAPLEKWDHDWALVLYYSLTIFLFSTLSSMVMVPYNAMIPDMSNGYHSRTFVVLFMLIFAMTGSAIASVLWEAMIQAFQNNNDIRKAYIYSAICLAIPFGIAMMLAVILGRERRVKNIKTFSEYGDLDDSDDNISKNKRRRHKIKAFLKEQWRDIMDIIKYPPFVSLLLFNLISLVGGSLFVNNFILWIKYVREEEQQTAISLLVLQSSFVITLFIWSAVSRIVGKIRVYLLGSLFIIIGLLSLFFFPKAPNVIYYISVSYVGIGTSVSNLVIYALMPDVVDMNSKETGKRREAVFYSFFTLMAKIGQGLAQLIAYYTLAFVGYLNPSEQEEQGVSGQTQSVKITMAVLIAIIPLLIRILGIIVALVYQRIVKKMTNNNEEQNEEKHALIISDNE